MKNLYFVAMKNKESIKDKERKKEITKAMHEARMHPTGSTLETLRRKGIRVNEKDLGKIWIKH